MDDKVRDRALHVKRRVGRQRAARHMHLNPHIMGVGHVADFFDFRNSPAVPDIRLRQLEQILLKIFRVLPA